MTITKERLDAIRAAAEKAAPGPWEVGPVDDTVVTHIGADGLRYEVAGIDGDYNSPDEWPTMEANAAHIANCDPQTILALLDALDAAEMAEPVAWMYPDGRAGHAVTMDRKVACDAFPGIANPVPLYTHPAPAVREGWKPLTENVVGPVLVCRFGDEDHNWLPLTAYRVTGGKWERPASRDGLPYEPTHWQRLPTAAPEAK